MGRWPTKGSRRPYRKGEYPSLGRQSSEHKKGGEEEVSKGNGCVEERPTSFREEPGAGPRSRKEPDLHGHREGPCTFEKARRCREKTEHFDRQRKKGPNGRERSQRASRKEELFSSKKEGQVVPHALQAERKRKGNEECLVCWIT